MKVTPRLEARLKKLRARGMSYEAIAEAVSGEKEVSYQTVRRILQKGEVCELCLPGVESTEETVGASPEVIPPPEQRALGEDMATVESTQFAIASFPEMPVAASPQDFPQGETRYAGAMLFHVTLGHLGLWKATEKLGAEVGWTKLAVKQVIGIIALGIALRLRSIEGFSNDKRPFLLFKRYLAEDVVDQKYELHPTSPPSLHLPCFCQGE